MKKRKTDKKQNYLSKIVALIMTGMMIFSLPAVCGAESDPDGDNHIGTGIVKIINLKNTGK